jgi:hypothetical protein
MNNPVAKHGRTFNKSQTMRDRKNDYKRKDKFTVKAWFDHCVEQLKDKHNES